MHAIVHNRYNPMLRLGVKRALQQDDVWTLPESRSSARLAQPVAGLTNVASMARASPMWGLFVLCGIVRFMTEVASFLQPLLLNQLMRFLADKPTVFADEGNHTTAEGYILACCMFIAAATQALCLQHFIALCFECGAAAKSTLMHLIFAKATRKPAHHGEHAPAACPTPSLTPLVPCRCCGSTRPPSRTLLAGSSQTFSPRTRPKCRLAPPPPPRAPAPEAAPAAGHDAPPQCADDELPALARWFLCAGICAVRAQRVERAAHGGVGHRDAHLHPRLARRRRRAPPRAPPADLRTRAHSRAAHACLAPPPPRSAVPVTLYPAVSQC
jgi:hypothetical protein